MGRTIYRDIEIRGVTYPTAPAAARALGVTPDTIRRARRNGTLHRVGLGRVGVEPMPIRIRGLDYADAHAAAVALGVTAAAVWQAAHKGTLDRVGLGPRRDNPSRARPVAIGSASYASMAVASKVLGFGESYISQALRRKSKRAMERIVAAQMAMEAEQEAAAWRKRAA